MAGFPAPRAEDGQVRVILAQVEDQSHREILDVVAPEGLVDELRQFLRSGLAQAWR